ncbi:aldehyde ferredoxin oxidoreductase C-terminal domain-containing protein [Virgibacillus halophilus]|uniref:Aldehyde ferredoxin oxidoreductase C-terminal domain-containing protein n=1 Tax=Tigheibacillus halophilus TaxID=361280 RepID=A0ABU5C2Y6_9BACI|nr:aldehyde ferredoxin oxidoreductase C-terminal domain-containing protein [Virgibacillus halophilus]
MRSNELAMWQHNAPGFGVWIHTHGIDASLCVNNYQTSKFPSTNKYDTKNFMKYYRGEANIPGCPMNIIKKFSVSEENEDIGGIHQEAAGALGPNLGITDITKIIKANVLCNKYGLDPNSLGYTISFIQECAAKGIYNNAENINLDFNDNLDLLSLIEMISERTGVGDLLAEGSARAAKEIGNSSSKYALTVKNNEMVPFEPRSQTNLALGYATSPTGPRYDICEHDWDYDVNYGWEHTLDYSRTVGILERIPMEYVGRKKVRNYKALNTIWSAADGLSISLFSTAPTRVYSLEDMAKLIRIVTGWETSSYEVMRIGELRNQIYRFYNYREGFTSKDDYLPERFFNLEIDSGPQKRSKNRQDGIYR